MNFETKSGFYFDLDCLYDTRLATLELIDPRLAKLAIAKGYYTRVQDAFPYVDKKTFRELYKTRDTKVLDIAARTSALDVLGNFVKDSVVKITQTPFQNEINVYLNVYPYEIDRQTAQAMLEPMLVLTARAANIHILNIPPEKLTLQFCRDNFSLMMMYDFEDWLEIYAKNGEFQKIVLSDITLFVPELYLTDNVPSVEEIKAITREGAHPFRAVEQMARNLIDLNMIDITYFCAKFEKGFIEQIIKEHQEIPVS